MVHKGMVVVRREGATHMALMGDVILLAPGAFELSAIPLAAGGDVCIEHAKLPLSVFPKHFAEGNWVEQVLLQAIPIRDEGVYLQKQLLPKVTRDFESMNDRLTVLQSVVNTLLNSFEPTMFSFLRRVYYERRWSFLRMMESTALQPRPVELLAASYADGRAAFFRDCRLFTGHTPRAWFARRRMELADSWLHVANRTIEEVAARLHYQDVRLFRVAYRKHFLRPPENPGPMLSSGSLSLDHPLCCLRPFWWPAPLPLVGVCQWPGLRPEEFPEGFEEERKSIEAPMEPSEEVSADAAAELPPDDTSDKEPADKSIEERFCNGEMIPIGEIIEFPTGLPELLKAA
jgi:AraC-like DNA-binding protein